MKKKLLDYKDSVEQALALDAQDTDWGLLLEDHLNHIRFFQHERLVHLIVTVSFGMFLVLITGYMLSVDEKYTFWSLFFLFLIISVTTICYVLHYFFLENNVQKLYDQYDELRKRSAHHKEFRH